ncbi:MAG TPA: triose-phosphate isomerase [Candidatus Acidoferrales bacterium]|jgi:triosephosphate isomerase|nr:triose-phosphate isomerase [Candidatus Acidoferrales bacterium]
MRRPVIAGNWKMYKTQEQARAFFSAFSPLIKSSEHCEIIVAPAYTALAASVEAVRGTAISIAAQNMHWQEEGACTGDVSAEMLVEVGCRAVIIAHSERRQFCGETDDTANKKVKAALAAGLTPILCVGELLADREAGKTEDVLEREFHGGVAALTGAEFSRIILAYEPVWAIGTGRTATPEMAADAHRFLRQLAAANFTSERASGLRILYGGSVKPDNIRGLMAQVEIDGALVGGASLNAEAFASIVNF